MNGFSSDLASSLDPVVFGESLGFEAEGWQKALLRSTAPRSLVLCARQVGKTRTTSLKALWTALYNPGRLVLIISPTARQSDEMLLSVSSLYRAMGEQPRAKKDNTSELWLGNGSRIVSLPGSEGGIRGFSGAKLVILDEASRVDDAIFASVLPMVASDGSLTALSTPWGKRGWFFRLHDDDLNGWERHKVTVYESDQYTEARIAEVRGALGSFEFASDYLCQFGDTQNQLFSTESVRAAFSPGIKALEF